jgi:hypothetical protein
MKRVFVALFVMLLATGSLNLIACFGFKNGWSDNIEEVPFNALERPAKDELSKHFKKVYVSGRGRFNKNKELYLIIKNPETFQTGCYLAAEKILAGYGSDAAESNHADHALDDDFEQIIKADEVGAVNTKKSCPSGLKNIILEGDQCKAHSMEQYSSAGYGKGDCPENNKIRFCYDHRENTFRFRYSSVKQLMDDTHVGLGDNILLWLKDFIPNEQLESRHAYSAVLNEDDYLETSV